VSEQNFSNAYASYLAAEAAVAAAAADEKVADKAMNETTHGFIEAANTLTATPAVRQYQFLQKLNIVEELVIQQETIGKSRDLLGIRAVQSFKADFIRHYAGPEDMGDADV
jgi:hypothetical protein